MESGSLPPTTGGITAIGGTLLAAMEEGGESPKP